MLQYVIFENKEEVDAFCQKVDVSLGYPKEVNANTNNYTGLITYATYATPIKKYNAEEYAYPVTNEISHLVPAEKEMKYDLGNWYPDAII